MNNEKINQMIDEAYENYSQAYEKDNSVGLTLLVKLTDGMPVYRKPTIDMFVAMCTYDENFSEKWGLKIEERELSAKERWDWYGENGGPDGEVKFIDLIVYENEKDNEHIYSWLKNFASNVPTKLIKMTYNNETIESYE